MYIVYVRWNCIYIVHVTGYMGGAPGYVPPGMGHYGQRQGHQQQMKHGKRKSIIKVLYINDIYTCTCTIIIVHHDKEMFPKKTWLLATSSLYLFLVVLSLVYIIVNYVNKLKAQCNNVNNIIS